MRKNIFKDLISIFFTTALILTLSQMASCRLMAIEKAAPAAIEIDVSAK